MSMKAFSMWRRFKRTEDGNVNVEFAFIIPSFIFVVLAGVELSLVTVQQTMLERAVDLTVRDVRLGTGSNFQHDDLKEAICVRAQFIKECSSNLRLEMIEQSAFDGIVLSTEADCTDKREEVNPVLNFNNGAENQLMILRACARIDPVFPTTVIGKTLVADSDQYALTATTAFVQEPM